MRGIPKVVQKAPVEIVLAAFAAVAHDDLSMCIPIGKTEGLKAINYLRNVFPQIQVERIDIEKSVAWVQKCMEMHT